MSVTPKQWYEEREKQTLCCEVLLDALSVLIVNYCHIILWVIN